MAQKIKREESCPKRAGWIMTYGDMMSLLLTFFILIVSYSTIQEAKFEEATNSLQGAFGVLSSPPTTIKMEEVVVSELHKKERDDVVYEFSKLERTLVEENLDNLVDLQLTKDGVLFKIDDSCLFTSGKAELKTDSHTILTNLREFLAKFSHEVEINGHTDSVPIHTVQFPSNWELSSARAISVARYFQNEGLIPDRIKAVGYGEYKPLAENDSSEGRAKNRRVEIFLNFDSDNPAVLQELPVADKENNGTG
ncbi:OmpA family protein [bacterium]|jgi:chemotaxis protein MotB|nr:OmpA family protein [bacterium]MBT7310747.1 OmpA family protein [bacterium]